MDELCNQVILKYINLLGKMFYSPDIVSVSRTSTVLGVLDSLELRGELESRISTNSQLATRELELRVETLDSTRLV